MAARAHRVIDAGEGAKALGSLFARYPAQEGEAFAPPSPEQAAIFHMTSVVVSVLDHALCFVHADLVERERQPAVAT